MVGGLIYPAPAMGLVAAAFAAASAVVFASLPRPLDWSQLRLTFAGCLLYVLPVVIVADVASPLYPVTNPLVRSGAIGRLRQIASAEAIFESIKGRFGSVDDLIQEQLLDPGFTGTLSGWQFSVVPSATDFTATATPVNKDYIYYTTADGVVRYVAGPRGYPKGTPVFP